MKRLTHVPHIIVHHESDGEADRQRSALREELTRQNAELQNMRREEKEQRSQKERENASRRAEDQDLLCFLIHRFGPLDGTIFANSAYPGAAYRQLCSVAVRRIEAWWAAIWPWRLMRKHEAATFLQKMAKGRRGRKNFRSLKARERLAKRSLRRLRSRTLLRGFIAWYDNVQFYRGVKERIALATKSVLRQRFEIWCDFVRIIKKRMHAFLQRWKLRNLSRSFFTWKAFTRRNQQVKEMARRVLSRSRAYYFECWDRFILENREKGVIGLQRITRGYLARKLYRRKQRRKMRKEEKRKRVMDRKRRLQKEEAMEATEQWRRRQETLARESAAVAQRKKTRQGFTSLGGYLKLFARGRAKVRADTKGGLSLHDAIQLSKDEIIQEDIERAQEKAQREFRNEYRPQYTCPTCPETFSCRRLLKSHICKEVGCNHLSQNRGLAHILARGNNAIAALAAYDTVIERYQRQSLRDGKSEEKKRTTIKAFQTLASEVEKGYGSKSYAKLAGSSKNMACFMAYDDILAKRKRAARDDPSSKTFPQLEQQFDILTSSLLPQ